MSTQRAADAFDALADPQRRAILEMLAEHPHAVGALADRLPISRPAVSRHLKLLKDAALVVDEPQGTKRLYRLHEDGAESVRRYLETVWGDALRRFGMTAESTSQ